MNRRAKTHLQLSIERQERLIADIRNEQDRFNSLIDQLETNNEVLKRAAELHRSRTPQPIPTQDKPVDVSGSTQSVGGRRVAGTFEPIGDAASKVVNDLAGSVVKRPEAAE